MTAAGAEHRIHRTVSVLLGVGAVVFTALDAGAITAQWSAASPVWSAAALAACAGGAVVLAAMAPFVAMRTARRVAGVAAAAPLIALATLPLVFPPVGSAGSAPWPLGLTALGTTAAALAWPPAIAWAATAAVGVLVAVGRAVATTVDLGTVALQDAGYTVFFDAVFVALAIGALRAARRVDALTEATTGAAAGAAALAARQDERTRVDALVHDQVLATLLTAGRDPAVPGLAAQAADALDGLRGLCAGDAAAALAGVGELTDRLRGLTTAVVPWAEFSSTGSLSAPAVPGEVAEALLGAAGEAMRNAARHAPGADVAVHLAVAGGGIEIAVVDDGDGFVPGPPTPGRLGLAVSVVGRMRAAGGDAEVRSRPGRGTAVRITWPR